MNVDVAIPFGAGGELSRDTGVVSKKLPNPRLEGYLRTFPRSHDEGERVLLTRDETYEGTDFP